MFSSQSVDQIWGTPSPPTQGWPTPGPRGMRLQSSFTWRVSVIQFNKHNRSTEHNVANLINSNKTHVIVSNSTLGNSVLTLFSICIDKCIPRVRPYKWCDLPMGCSWPACPNQWILGALSLHIKNPEHEASNSPLSGAKFKNSWSCNLSPLPDTSLWNGACLSTVTT